MKVIVGLGNPGKKYENTRHNAGFLVIDGVSEETSISVNSLKFNALIGQGFYKGQKIILVKPQTFMNLSGDAVIQILNYYDVDLEDLLVVSDDLDLPVGTLKVRRKGSSGGQRGIQSIIDRTGSNEFARIKVGIGKNPLIPTVDYVLGKMDDQTAIKPAIQCVMDYLNNDDLTQLMNTYNKKED
ncbi:peptidyl-tRNA hydrolase [Erysipelothrix larvae]|uniref:Peptidyl-tRNA hydrolase n=1 Tax=Erysipelothrix larvae TaxID=1514105 RepID=A0A0X8H224_9FIRM|nr:aminoacyl-tRNA hydrolase [Erysipelothrix larvae]AMC94595.1 peptidyl-tRNA hydrolase [Erysipelothrix larvae]